jgi:glycosyltransferase involved in cell wall biosynthesis
MKIWLDISLFIKTKGSPHGIARIESNLVHFLQIIDEEIGFFWVDDKSKSFFSISLPTQFRNSKKTIKRGKLLNPSLLSLKNTSIEDRFKVVIPAIISFFPTPVDHFILMMFKKFYKMVCNNKLYLKVKSKNIISSEENLQKKIKRKFRKDAPKPLKEDILLIASNDWDRRSYEHVANQLGFLPKLAVVIYDVIPYSNPEFAVDIKTASRFNFWLSDIAQKSAWFFHISEFTKNEFMKMLKDRCIESYGSHEVLKLPSGLALEGREQEPNFSAFINDIFLLVVGTLEVRKNHKILLTAANEALRRGEEFPQMIFVGSKGWGYDEIRRSLEMDTKLRDKVIHVTKVNDEELRWLYKRCTAVAYPSLIEGLGLPVLEAHTFGKRVICSTAKVFREILDPEDITLSPYDAVAWKNNIQRIFREKKNKPKTLVRTSTWEDVVFQIISCLRSTSEKIK